MSPDRISIRSWPAGRRSVTFRQDEVGLVSVRRGRAVATLRIFDAGQNPSDVVVEMPLSVAQIVGQLKVCGYEVADRSR